MRKRIIYILLPLILFSACRKEPAVPVPAEEEGWTTVHLRATVSGGLKTKATLDDLDRHYIFERDDLLYVVNRDSGRELYGFLYLVAGAGETDAVFEGDLMYFNPSTYEPEEPDAGFAITATLVSAAQRSSGFFTTVSGNDGKLATGPNYGNAVASTFKEAVQKYSHFTGDATFGNPTFSLSQQSAFVIFQFSFDDDLGSGDLTFQVNNNGSEVRSMTVTPDTYKRASFVAAFPNGTALSSANVKVTGGGLGGGSGVQRDMRNATLQANRYYNVNQCYVDLTYFTIQAGNAATDITFNYSTIDYSTDDGSTWTSAGTTPTVSVAAGSHIKVRGTATSYDYNTASKTIFTSTEPCYIYGDIMSLLSNATSLGEAALRGAFKNMANIDIPPGRPLQLSASTLLGNNSYQEMFAGCTGLTYPPEFSQSLTTITRKACMDMFSGCTGLTEAPELPATTVNDAGYYGMFRGCTSMEIPPARLAQTVKNPTNNIEAGSCREMFQNCTSLRYAPELPATSVPVGGYYAMFDGCTSLLSAPELPATTVEANGYNRMFQNCTALTTGPSELPATNMNSNCYQLMFSGCSALAEAPEIKATTLAVSCFYQMFLGCSRLRAAQDDFYFTNVPNYACYQMFMNCLALNNAPNMPNVTGTIGTAGCRDMYNNCGEMATAPVELKATTVGENGYYQMFYLCLKIKVAPSISATNVGKNSCYRMFRGCTRLQTPPASLPATTLGEQAYREMFFDCKALKSTPLFPTANATFSGVNVCYQMFQNCITLSELKGQLFGAQTALTNSCFNSMFRGCTYLSTVPQGYLPATTLANYCYQNMFHTTALVSAPALPATTLKEGCYQSMFNGALFVESPVLEAQTLVKQCYQEMFRNCKSLSKITCLATDMSASNCLKQWVESVASSGTFFKAASATWPAAGVSSIPSGWTVTDYTP